MSGGGGWGGGAFLTVPAVRPGRRRRTLFYRNGGEGKDKTALLSPPHLCLAAELLSQLKHACLLAEEMGEQLPYRSEPCLFRKK